MGIKKELMQEIIDYTAGTPHSLYYVCEIFNVDEDDLSMDNLYQLDDQIFQCCECGWWCEISEQNEVDYESVCNSCYELEDF